MLIMPEIIVYLINGDPVIYIIFKLLICKLPAPALTAVIESFFDF